MPDTGNIFTGGSGACGTDMTCTLPPQSGNLGIDATFQPPGAKKIDIAFAGAAPGFVSVLARCSVGPSRLDRILDTGEPAGERRTEVDRARCASAARARATFFAVGPGARNH